MRNAKLLALFLAAGLLVTACTSDRETPPTSTPIPALGSAWQAVLDQVQPDGTVSAQTALQAFAVAFGPLPGVSVPPGDPGTIPSGTAALRWLVGHWQAITPEQRAAAAALVPELQDLRAGSTATGVNAPAAVRVAPTPKRSDFFYTQLAEQAAKDIEARVGTSLGIPIQAKVGVPVDWIAAAETGVYTSSGGHSGTPGKCVITISAAGDSYVGDDVAAMIAHEVWHCFQGAKAGLARYWSASMPSWVREGEAEWVGATLYPNAPINSMFWPNYLNSPQVGLFARSYTAIGFYAQLASSGVNTWTKLLPILLANDNSAAFVAAGADQDSFLDIWSSGYAREATRGTPWDITGPGVTGTRASRTPLQVAAGASVAVQAAPYANAVYGISDGSAEVLMISTSGHGRVSDGAGHDYLTQGDGTFCHRPGGCACPNQQTSTPPPPALPGPDVVLAITGGPAGASGTVVGKNLKEYCEGSKWHGRWLNDNGLALGEGTMTFVQKGQQITGTADVTGNTCVRHGTISGTIAGSTVHIVLSSERVVTMDGQISGNNMSGTWSAPSCGPPYGPANITVTVTGTWQATKIT